MFILSLFATSPEGAPNPLGTWFMIFAFILIFYFLLIRPQRRQQKEHEAMVEALKKGDEVITLGGIIGTIVHIKDHRITLRTGDTRIEVERSKIGNVLQQKGTADE
jgi:preprotein translocase subunit YajC